MTHRAYALLNVAKLHVDEYGYVNFSTLRRRLEFKVEKAAYQKLISELVDDGKLTFPSGSYAYGKIT